MEPAGNTRFDREGAWVREDLVKSEEVLDARAELTTDFLRLDLEKSVRAAHVEFVKRSTPKPHAPYPGESIRRAPTFANATPFAEPLAPDVWRNLHDRFFGDLRAVELTSQLVARYIDSRQQEEAENATINRELAVLKRMFSIARQSTPPKVNGIPYIAMLREDNTRTGFLESKQHDALASQTGKVGLWLRAMFETGYTYGGGMRSCWRYVCAR
jgi:hypothetical protein